MSLLPASTDRCSNCGRTWGSLLALALAMELGAQASPSPLDCAGGGEHDFPDGPAAVEVKAVPAQARREDA
jgi:hypothetical protein